MIEEETFTTPLLSWFEQHGRKHLPWQKPKNAYRVWVSEIMLQQTQVTTVIPYYIKFMQQFPTIQALAAAHIDSVFAQWSGLGYYRRASFLHQTARIIMRDFQGQFPHDMEQIKGLPGIGPSTAAAICSLAFNQAHAILDGNVQRILTRYFAIDTPITQASTRRLLQEKADGCMAKTHCAEYTQAIMDLGATVCLPKNPRCSACPLQVSCKAHLQQNTADYPVKIAKKKVPTKHIQVILLHNTNESVYLEKRPQQGIWSQLWSLPMLEMDQCLQIHFTQPHELHDVDIAPITRIKHTFSHFIWQMQVLGIAITPSAALKHAKNAPGQWFHRDNLAQLGLAKPISQLLLDFLNVKMH